MSNKFPTLNFFKIFQKQDDVDFKDQEKKNLKSIATPSFDDGAKEVESEGVGYFGSAFGSNIDIDFRDTTQLINTYRSLMNNYEVENAVDDIISDAIVYEDENPVVKIDLDRTAFSNNIKTKIAEELDIILNALKFETKGADHFRRWYIDSRIYFHKIIDPKHPKNGIQELRRLDPRNTKYMREIITRTEEGVKIVDGYKEFFLYDTGKNNYISSGQLFSPGERIKIPKSAVAYAHSGKTDCEGNIIGYLHRAVKPANQLKLLEDAMVIYRLTRAPDRRIFYIDTGNLPKTKASQMMQGIMNNMRNKIVYDSSTGKVKNQQHAMSMTEDYWLQRRDGKAVTEVDTLPGASGMNEMDDVRYFRDALYLALRVPLSRIPDSQNGQNNVFDSSSSVITRDELEFAKFIETLLHQFSPVILDPLKTNLILKKIITEDEWDNEINNIKLIFNKDSYYEEIKEADIFTRRLGLLEQVQPFAGMYYSHQTIMKKILHMTDEEIKEEGKLIDGEKNDPRYQNDEDENLEDTY